ncbi:MAG: hypothetical protein K0S45_2485 [Nitrospira sp.]|nr:hypothetical protein [Nitrospira sp.]
MRRHVWNRLAFAAPILRKAGNNRMGIGIPQIQPQPITRLGRDGDIAAVRCRAASILPARRRAILRDEEDLVFDLIMGSHHPQRDPPVWDEVYFELGIATDQAFGIKVFIGKK